MELEERVASALRAQVSLVEARPPTLPTIRRAARWQARRRTAVAVGAATVAAVIAVTAGLVDRGRQDRSVPPADRRERTDGAGVLTIPDDRATQLVVRPTVRSDVIPGERRVASTSTDDPQYDGGGQLSLPLDLSRPGRWKTSCTGAPETRYVVVAEPGALHFSSGRCDGAPHAQVHFEEAGSSAAGATLRMFVTEQDLREFRRCFTFSPPEGCAHLEPRPATGTGARMQLVLHHQVTGPVAATIRDEEVRARAVAFGSVYSLTTVAAAASGARELSFQVEPSPRERIAQAMQLPTDAWGRCLEAAGARNREACEPKVELLVDDRPVDDQQEGPFSGRAGWGPLAPRARHDITFRVVEGDPRNVDLAVVIYEEDR